MPEINIKDKNNTSVGKMDVRKASLVLLRRPEFCIALW